MSPSPKSDELLEDRKVLSLALLCTLIVIVVSGACFLTYWKGTQALRERGEWEFDHTLETLGSETEAALGRWISEMELWAKQPYMIRVLDQDVDNEIGESLDAVAQHSEHLQGLACVAIDGREIAYARSLGGPTQHEPIGAQDQEHYLDGLRGEVAITAKGLSIRVPVFLEFGDRTVIGCLVALLDARAVLPRAPLSWVALQDEGGQVLVEQEPRMGTGLEVPGRIELGEEGWLRKTTHIALPRRVDGPGFVLDFAQRRDDLFGQIPVLRALVVAISVCSSVILLSMLVAFFTHQRNLMNRLSERAGHLRDLNVVLKNSRLELRDETMRAEAASRAKSDFLARMSHEIRTPLNGVIGASSALGEMELSADGRELTEIIGSSGELLLAIIDDLLDFSRIEAGKLELDQVPFELWALIDSTVLLAGSGSKSGVQLYSFPRGDVPRLVEGDPTRLRQILINLIGNAVKFTAAGEIRVDVTLEERLGADALLRFTVSDTGEGIPAHALTKIFEPFTQADRSTAQEHGGTGLGLAICKRLVGAMGELQVTSEVGVGSSFHFAIRLRTAAADEAPSGMSGSVLLVTSTPTVAELFEHHLAYLGAPVTVAMGASEGEALLRSDTVGGYDRIVIDGDLDGRDGLELVRLATANSIEKERLVVLLPVGAPRSLVEREELGVTVMMKPLRAREVLRIVAREGTTSPTGAGSRPIRVPSLRRPRVLLAEDRLANQRVATLLLQRLGCEVDIARHGGEAVEAATRLHYDLILMDCLMPVMDGLDATREIRKRESAGGRSTILALTASALPSDQERCLAAGMDGILTKPLRIEDLDVALRRWMRPAKSG